MIDRIVRASAELMDVPGHAVIGTDLDGRILYWSPGAQDIYGWSEQEALGRNILDLTPSDLKREEAGHILSELKKGRTWSGEFQVRKRDGTTFLAFVRDLPVHGPDGQLVGILGVSEPATGDKD